MLLQWGQKPGLTCGGGLSAGRGVMLEGGRPGRALSLEGLGGSDSSQVPRPGGLAGEHESLEALPEEA